MKSRQTDLTTGLTSVDICRARFTYDYELNEEGSRLTPEFVFFLKGTD